MAEQPAVAQPEDDCGDRVPAGAAEREPDRHRVEDVGQDPLDDPVPAAILEREKEPERDERERQPVVEARLGGDGEMRLPLVLLPGRPDADVPARTGIRRGERRAEHDRRRERKPHDADAEERDRRRSSAA